jgi:eukaryotic-like serine/threonine-protein kinase
MAHIGQQLGHYRLIRLLGQGGFAEVYLGEHLRLKIQVAIKVLHLSLKDDDLEQFLQEAQTIAHLKHPHIVRVFDFDVEAQTPFLVMDYLPHGNLRQRYPKGTRLPLTAVVSSIKQVASALQYAHDEKLVHRDIKPENILLDEHDALVLSDFGTALLVQSSWYQNTQGIAGTAAYMAPEQFQGRPRRASDQYALGVVVYEWLCGDRPFHGTFTEIASQHLFVPPPSLREKVPAIPPAVEEVVLRALAKDPQERFPCVQAFATAFEQASETAEALQATVPLPSSTALVVTKTPPTPASPPAGTDAPSLSPAFSPAMPLPAAPLPLRPRHYLSSSRTRLLTGMMLLVIVTSGVLSWPLLARWLVPAALPSLAAEGAYPTQLGDTAMFGLNPQHTRFNAGERTLTPANVSRLVPLWSDHTTGAITSSPTVANGLVYVGSGNRLSAFNAANGTLLWSTATDGLIYYSSPAVAHGLVYIGSQDGKLSAFNASNGILLWSVAAGNAITSSPTIAGGIVYIGSQDGKLSAFNAFNGTLLWSTPTGAAITSSPAVAGGIVYIGSQDGKLYAFHAASGKVLWSVAAGNAIDASPAVANGVVYIGSGDFRLYAFNAVTGHLLWSAPTGFFITSSPAIANGVVYISSDDSKLYAFNAVTGHLLWSTSIGHAFGPSSPTVANAVVYVGSQDSRLFAFNASTGTLLWSTSTGAGIYSSPVVAGGVVYIGSHDTSLHAFHLPGRTP